MFLISKGICEVTVPDTVKVTSPKAPAKARKRGMGRRRSSADILVGAVENFTDFINHRNQRLADEKADAAKPLEVEEGEEGGKGVPVPEQRKSYKGTQQDTAKLSMARLATFRITAKDMPGLSDLPGMKKMSGRKSSTQSLPSMQEDGSKREAEDGEGEKDERVQAGDFKSQIVKKEKVVKELLAGE